MAPEGPTSEYEPAPDQTWRHVRTAVTLLVLVGFVVGAAWYGWDKVMGDDGSESAEASPTCVPVTPTDAPDPDAIELNVYNATSRNGLASGVAEEMRDRGFIIMDVDNDPQQSTVEEPAEIRAHPDQEEAAAFVAALVPGSVIVMDDRSSETVDLVLGDEFEELAAEPDPDATIEACT